MPPRGAMLSIPSDSGHSDVKVSGQHSQTNSKRKSTHVSSASHKRPSSSSLQSSDSMTQQGTSGRAAPFSYSRVHELYIAEQMALPENWPVLSARGKMKKNRRSKRDVYVDIALEFNKKFTAGERAVEIDENQLKNKVENMYRTFYSCLVFYKKTDELDGSPSLYDLVLTKCHYFFILYEVGAQTDEDIVIRDNESYCSSLTRQASTKVVVQHDIENPDWSDTGNSSNDGDDGNGDVDDGSSDYGRRILSDTMSVTSTNPAKKSKQQIPSAQSKKKGQPQPDIELVVEFLREVEEGKQEIERRRLVMEEERHALYRKERELKLRNRELEIQEREIKVALERKKLQESLKNDKAKGSSNRYRVSFYNNSRSNSSSPTRSATRRNSQDFLRGRTNSPL
ncbi:hypothetical protein BGX27_002614 [Mortierella sp. AM989]|nr:hypothetical protein BGX27_002614 [Mortierella sp. AM989]